MKLVAKFGLAIGVSAALLIPASSYGSPWTLPRGVALMRAGFDFQLATSEFIDRGPERDFPLNGRFTGAALDLGLRLGISDQFELEFGLPIRVVTFTADPTIIQTFDGTDPDAALAHYQANIIDFSRNTAGVGDLRLTGRYQLLLQPLAIAAQIGVKAPTGYSGPEGTFGREPTTLEAFEADRDNLVTPDRIRDDVTLGDAQLDLSAQVLVGASFSSGTFIRASGGYNLRLAGAGDQVLADLRIGQALTRRLLIFAFGRLAYTVESGRSIGVTVSAEDPDLPASSFANFVNTRAFVRRLESDSLDVGGGLIWRVVGPVELNVTYSRTIWGRFVAATHALSTGIGLRLDLFERPST